MLTPQLMASMSDEHLIAALHAEFEPLTATDVEIELLRRIESILYDASEADVVEGYSATEEELAALLEAHEADIATCTAMLATLNDNNISNKDELLEKLERSDKFFDIAEEYGDAFTRLADLAKSTQ